MRKIYEVTRYQRHSVFDKNENLVWRWFRVEKYCFTNKAKAVRYFTACNYFRNEKAVLRVMKGGKHGKR